MSNHIIAIRSNNPKVQHCIELFRLVEGYKGLARAFQNKPNSGFQNEYFWDMSEIKERELVTYMRLLHDDELSEYVEKTNQIYNRMGI